MRTDSGPPQLEAASRSGGDAVETVPGSKNGARLDCALHATDARSRWNRSWRRLRGRRIIDAARRTASSPTASSRRASASSGVDLSAVRTWARANGHTVSDRGRVPNLVIAAFKDAS
ncbi:Lsr2 family DNA-binding protein [Microbacterium proteolyticum]|uniref:Lsr2 family DNA-binding protein n=1 Tax=Microbacterium proteolyticum TaxID=1572644 RepID=UPI00160B9A6E